MDLREGVRSMIDGFQLPIPFINHEVDNDFIQQRIDDGYINATAMCKSAGKQFKHYNENQTTKDFLQELSSVVGIPTTELIRSIQGGNPQLQGTWVHPKVAIHLAQWLSPKFSVLVVDWVHDWLTGNLKLKAQLPYHISRYIANRGEIPHTHFSILNEMIFGLIAPLESEGYTLPEKLMPDISEGKMFCKWLREGKGIEPNNFPTYKHIFEDGRIVDAKLYPNELLAEFRLHFNEVWIPQRAVTYFQERDIKALPYLPKALGIDINSGLISMPKKSITQKVVKEAERAKKKVKKFFEGEDK